MATRVGDEITLPTPIAWFLVGVGLLLGLQFVTIPSSGEDQLIIAVCGFVLLLILNRRGGRLTTIFLMIISALVSLRYIYWRYTETFVPEDVIQGFFMLGLLLAETYAVAVLVISYFQTMWPLNRKPVPLPADTRLWPTVDVFIPTYNESLDVVKSTVMAALAMDWPEDKLNVYILDDGRRPEFRKFAEDIGCGYITRPDNKGAKAGNINHALKLTDGEFVAIFDSDHVPTRAFLQLTMGWMFRDPKLGLIQLPHHFYSPDPFQRNLTRGQDVPPEGLIFYGLVQPGNDLWNAAFFCGSCAVLRRKALDDIGGVPTETVTEDAHCSLRMQRKGWNTAYLRLPLAAGLATERLIIHIGQRMRWARGMIQIFRRDNPFLGKGLSLPQRLCYFAAMFSWFFPLARVVFLTSPLAFLLFGVPVIAASPLAIVAYAGPHIVHAVATSSRVAGRVRHSFWSEVYETAVAFFLVPVVLVTLLDPKKGKFNVTSKGGKLEEGYFDLRAVWPSVLLFIALVLGLVSGVWGILHHPPSSIEFQAYLLNTVWAFFCVFPTLATVAVGRERRQQRAFARVDAVVPAVIETPGGLLPAQTVDISLSGVRLRTDPQQAETQIVFDALANSVGIEYGSSVHIRFFVNGRVIVLPARIVKLQDQYVMAQFRPLDVQQEALITELVFGRANAWLAWDQHEADRPFVSLWRVAQSIGGVFAGMSQFRRRRPLVTVPEASQASAVPSPSAAASPPKAGGAPPAPATTFVRPKRLAARAAGVGLCWLLASAGTVLAQDFPMALPGQGANVAQLGGGATGGEIREVVRSFRQLGVPGPMQLRGLLDLQGIVFGLRSDEVVLSAELELSGSWSPALIPSLSQLRITLNEEVVTTLSPVAGMPNFGPTTIPIPSLFFSQMNRLNFRFTGRYTQDCNDPLSGLLWLTLSDRSLLRLRVARLTLPMDLARLPEPFYNPQELREPLTLPVVFRGQSVPAAMVRAAAIATSWFAVQADFRGAYFPVRRSLPATGHAIVFVGSAEAAAELDLPDIDGPTLALRANPSDPFGQFLIVAGRTPAEAIVAAQALAVGARSLSGEMARVTQVSLAPRRPYDAPRWIPRDRPVRFGELVDPAALQGTGYVPSPITVPLRTAPDLYLPPGRTLGVWVRFVAPSDPIVDLRVSRMDAFLSDLFLQPVPLGSPEPMWPLGAIARWLGWADRPAQEARLAVPPQFITGQNELRFAFDLRPFNRGDCVGIPDELRVAILPESEIDLSRAYRFALMPNLAFFASAGFPFTRLADFSETALVLPNEASDEELTLALELVGRMASIVGHPATAIEVITGASLAPVAEKDLLFVGTPNRLPALANILRDAPFRLEQGRIAIATPPIGQQFREIFVRASRQSERDRATFTFTNQGNGFGLIFSFESPLSPSRVAVVVAAAGPEGFRRLRNAFFDPEDIGRMQGDLVVVNAGRVQSFRVGPIFERGSLPFWERPRYWFADRPEFLVLMLLGAAAAMMVPFYVFLRRRARKRLGEAHS